MKFIVFGSGPQAQYVLSTLIENKITLDNICIVDLYEKNYKRKKVLNCKVNCFIDDFEFKKDPHNRYILANSNLLMRKKLLKKINKVKGKFFSSISSKAIINKFSKIGKGVIICPNAVIASNVTVGSHCVIHSGCYIDHDTSIGFNTNLAPGVIIAGNSKIGRNNFLFTSAAIAPNVNICSNVIIGIGSSVTKSITKKGTYYGTPAKLKISK